jgi:hypothetical protein
MQYVQVYNPWIQPYMTNNLDSAECTNALDSYLLFLVDLRRRRFFWMDVAPTYECGAGECIFPSIIKFPFITLWWLAGGHEFTQLWTLVQSLKLRN